MTENVQLKVAGDVSGQIAIGNNILQIQNQGGVVYVVQQSNQSIFEKVKGPVERRPRAYPTLLDRLSESDTVRSSLSSKLSVSVFGENGVGKTTFLSHMAHLPETDAFSGGVVYLYAKGLGLDDLLQVIFDVFYTSPSGDMPTAGQLRHRLQIVEAVILLDDLSLGREDTQALLNIMPLSSFLFGSQEQSLWGDGHTVFLDDLPEKDCLRLFSREIGRELSKGEFADVQEICDLLGRQPLRIVKVASLIRTKKMTIEEIKNHSQEQKASLVVDRKLIDSMEEQQKKALAVLGASGGEVVPLGVINSLLKLPDAKSLLDGLVEMGIVWKQGAHYAATDGFLSIIEKSLEIVSWQGALVNYFMGLVSQQTEDSLIEEASELLLHIVRYEGDNKRWPAVIQIGRAVERILVLQKRWQAWLDLLNLILNAARSTRDRQTEAWALHQLGTRAMCLNYSDQARHLLSQALELRRALGDKEGIAVTQHNLGILTDIPSPIKAGKNDTEGNFKRIITYGGCGLFSFGGVILIGILMLYNQLPFNPPPTNTHVSVRTNSLIDTMTPSYTITVAASTLSITSSNTPTKTTTLTPSLTTTSSPTATRTKTSTITITPDVIGPSTPDSLSPRGQNNLGCPPSQVDLTWTESLDPSDIDSYEIRFNYRKTKDDSWTILKLFTDSGNVTTMDITNLVENLCANTNQYYRWRVRAIDSFGNISEWSPWRYFRAQNLGVD